jgi:hypothetical protein
MTAHWQAALFSRHQRKSEEERDLLAEFEISIAEVNMASPQRQDPDNYRPSYDQRQRARLESRASAAGAGFAWWWLFWIVIIALAIWWAGWGWGGSGGWWWSGRARTAPAYNSPAPGTSNRTTPSGTAGNGAITSGVAGSAITGYGSNQPAISGPGLSALTATNKHPYIGKRFQVNDVPVQNLVNEHVLWIGAHNSTPMLLVLAGNGNTASNAHINHGSLIDVMGTVEKAPPLAQAKHQWSLSGGDAAKLERQGAYIRAAQVHTVQH